MQLTINGEVIDVCAKTLADVLQLRGAQSPFVVALNKTFIPKHQWLTTTINDDDHIDILSPISGG